MLRTKDRMLGSEPLQERRDPNPMDVQVEGRLRPCRAMLGMSQSALAAQIGVSYRQSRKYARGANRVRVSTLGDAAGVLDVPVGFFCRRPAGFILQ